MDYVGRPLLGCLFVALLLLQWRFPLRRQHFSVLHRLVRNFVLSIPGFAIARLAMLPIPIAIEHAHDVRVREPLQLRSLALQERERARVIPERAGQHLYSDVNIR